MHSQSSIQPLRAELLPSAAKLLAQAFFTNPAHIYLCPDTATRAARLEFLLGGNLRMQPDLGASFCLVDSGAVEAMGFWTRSDAPAVGPLARLRAGLFTAPLHIGFGALRRAFEVTHEVGAHLQYALGHQPFWYLNNMAVREALRGTGIGSRLLREQLESLRRRDPGRPIALSTQRPENVVFYGRLGFEVVWDAEIGSGPRAFRNWTMALQTAA